MSHPDVTLAHRIVAAVYDLGSSPNEIALQDTIVQRFERDGVPYEREVRLSPADKIDFLCDVVGVEVKVDGALSAVTRQLHRYAQHDRVRHLVLITTRRLHIALPTFVNNKIITVVHLVGASL